MYETKLARDADLCPKCLVNGRTSYLTIDTGAKVTLLAKSLVDSLGKWPIPRPDSNLKLQSVTGHLIQTYGRYIFTFQIGTLRFKYACYVVDPHITAPSDGILGRDIITKYHLDISLHDSKITLADCTRITFKGKLCNETTVKQSLPQNTATHNRSKCKGSQNEKRTGFQLNNRQSEAKLVYLVRDEIIPPMSEVITLAKVTGIRQKNQLGVIESETLSEPGLATMDVLVKTKTKGNVLVRIMNITAKTIKLRKQETVGKFLQAMEDTKEQRTNDRSQSSDVIVNMTQNEFGNLFDWSKLGKDKK